MGMPPPTGPHAAEMLGANWPGSDEDALRAAGAEYQTAAGVIQSQASEVRAGQGVWSANARGVGFDRIAAHMNQLASRIEVYGEGMAKCGVTCEVMAGTVVGAKSGMTAVVIEKQAEIEAIKASASATAAASPETSAATQAAATAAIASVVAASAGEIGGIAASAAGSMPHVVIPPIPPIPGLPTAGLGVPGNAAPGSTPSMSPGVPLPGNATVGSPVNPVPGAPGSGVPNAPKPSVPAGPNTTAPGQSIPNTPGTPSAPGTPSTPNPGRRREVAVR